MTEVFYPDLSTSAVRELQLIVTEGTGAPQRLQDVDVRTEQYDERSLTLRQTATGRGWTASLTYVIDSQRATVVADVTLRSLTGRPLQAFAYYDPSLTKEGKDDTAAPVGDVLVASDESAASALVAEPGFTATSHGYLGASDGWTDLAADGTLDGRHRQAGSGNVVQTGQLTIHGLARQRVTLALGFGAHRDEALATAIHAAPRVLLHRGVLCGRVAELPPRAPLPRRRPWRPAPLHHLTDGAGRDRGQAPRRLHRLTSMPWAFGFDRTLAKEFGSYALMWPRDLYQVASAMLAAGDRAAADRALDYMLRVQQRPDGHLPQNHVRRAKQKRRQGIMARCFGYGHLLTIRPPS